MVSGGVALVGYSSIAEGASTQLAALAQSPELQFGSAMVLLASLFKAYAIHSEWSSLTSHPVPPRTSWRR